MSLRYLRWSDVAEHLMYDVDRDEYEMVVDGEHRILSGTAVRVCGSPNDLMALFRGTANVSWGRNK